MKGMFLPECIPAICQSLAESCNHVLSPALSAVCLYHLPLSIWPTTFLHCWSGESLPVVMSTSQIVHGWPERCHVSVLCHQERKWESDCTEEIPCG